jgi:NADH-quinone oxidoreductase subunit M
MMLALFIFIPLALGLAGWALSRVHPLFSRWFTLGANAINLLMVALLWGGAAGAFPFPVGPGSAGGAWLAELHWSWIPAVGISFSLGLDGLSLALLGLTAFLGIMSVLASWKGIKDRVGFFHLNLSLVLAGVNGVFLATDLFLFAFFWELMLVPMYFLIDLWGHENRHRAAVKFFIFTQVGGLLMLVSIIGLAVVHGLATGGAWSFAYNDLIGTSMSPVVGMLLMLGFFVAFAVKLPVFPLHTWLPDAHTEAPTAGSVILAGLLLKTGGYGLIRFAIPLFPAASKAFAPVAMGLAVAGIIYGGIMAFSQSDMKRLVAYTSVSHLGFVLLGVYAFTPLALSGAVLQMISHGISTGALFILVGALQDRIHTRDLNRMGGLWGQVPVMGAAALVLSMALVGLPGLVNFVAEFLVLTGTWTVSPVATVLAGIGLVIATVYALRMFQMAFHGAPRERWTLPDLSGREKSVLFIMIALLVFLGLFPQGVLDMVGKAVSGVLEAVTAGGLI